MSVWSWCRCYTLSFFTELLIISKMLHIPASQDKINSPDGNFSFHPKLGRHCMLFLIGYVVLTHTTRLNQPFFCTAGSRDFYDLHCTDQLTGHDVADHSECKHRTTSLFGPIPTLLRPQQWSPKERQAPLLCAILLWTKSKKKRRKIWNCR